MTRVTVKPQGQPPSEQIVQAAQQEHVVTDARGRSITLRKPGVLAQYRLVEAVGESATNQVYVAMIVPLIFVAAIDGVLVPFPSNKAQLEALISRLDEEGVEAVTLGVREHFGLQDQQETDEAVKK